MSLAQISNIIQNIILKTGYPDHIGWRRMMKDDVGVFSAQIPNHITGWWLKNHLEKYEFVNGWWIIHSSEMENKNHVPKHQPVYHLVNSWISGCYHGMISCIMISNQIFCKKLSPMDIPMLSQRLGRCPVTQLTQRLHGCWAPTWSLENPP